MDVNQPVLASGKPPSTSVLSTFRGLGQLGFLDYIGEAWKQHGDLFRLNFGVKSMLLAINPNEVQYVNVTAQQHFGKGKSYDGVRKYMTGNGLVASTGPLWEQQRKLMSPFFTPKGIQAYGSKMIDDSLEMAERWDGIATSGKVVDMEDEMMRVTASIILKSMFSSEMDQETLEMKECVAVMIQFASARLRGFALPDWMPTAKNREYFASKEKVYRYISRIIEERKALPRSDWPDDLLAKLMLVKDEDTGDMMAESLVRDESLTAFFAGHETTATAMCATWYVLAKHGEVREKLHEEIDRVLERRKPTLEDFYQLPYTLRVVKEVLRLYPAAPFYVRDALHDTTLAGHPVKKGTPIMLSPYYTHRHPDFWEDPNRFDPDRWAPEKEKARHKYAYHPFATGKRICIGNNFSLLESQILLATLAQKFTPKLPAGEDVNWVALGTLSTKGGIPMKIERRA